MDRGPRSYAAECVGTFALCFVGQGALCTAQLTGNVGSALLPVALAHGFTLAVMVSALGNISGGHFNPAVTLGFAVTGRQSAPAAAVYVAAQLVGATVASLLLRSLFPASVGHAARLGAGTLSTEITTNAAVMIEAVLTFLLTTVVWGATVDAGPPRNGGIAVGLTYAAAILMGGPLTGGIMNPARAFGAAVASGYWAHHWVFWFGPALGAIAASLLYARFLMRRTPAAR